MSTMTPGQQARFDAPDLATLTRLLDGLTGAVTLAEMTLVDPPQACGVCKVAREQGDHACPSCGTNLDPWADVRDRA